MRILIAGGVAAGASAAVKARRTNEDADIVLLEKTGYVSFANCGLPYHIGGVIEDREELLLVTPELFKSRFNIDVRLGCEVTAIDRTAKTVSVNTPQGIVSERYDKLILATGGEPVRPDIPGIDLKNVHTVFTVPDADSVVSAIADGIKSAVVIGGGFIGLETAENLAERGIKTTLIERLPKIMSNMDDEFSSSIESELCANGVEVFTGASVTEIRGDQRVNSVALDDGREIKCELVILALGARPSTNLAQIAGLELGESGGIVVDASMRTSDPDIYAAGDIAESLHLVTGKKVRIPLAGSANKQGRIAGANAASVTGSRLQFKGVLGTYIVKVFGLTAGGTGVTEREAAKLGMSYETAYIPGFSNATYYPGAERLIIKLITETFTGRLLGAQIIGGKGVDKRLDVFAAAIYSGLTVFDLEQLDLAYAPPFSSAKDPVIMSGMICSNRIRGEMDYVMPTKLHEALADSNTILLDVRTQEEFDEGAIDGAVLIPVDELRERYAELDCKKTIIVYCKVGYRAYNACLFLNSKGYKTLNLSGGYTAYKVWVKPF